MRLQAALLVIFSLILTACNQNTPPADRIPVVGEAIDSSAIASDTLQQKSIEQSYEYAQTVVVNPKLVYDIRGYGGPASHGQYCILRRGADNKNDTVLQRERTGIIVNAFTGDLNNNGNEEIYIITRKPQQKGESQVDAFEFDKKGSPSNISFVNDRKHSLTINGADSVLTTSRINLWDTIFVERYKHSFTLCRKFVFVRKSDSDTIGGHSSYALDGLKFHDETIDF